MSRPINLQQGEGQSREILLLIKPAQYWVIKIFMLTKIVYLDNKISQFENGCNKAANKQHVKQVWSEIILTVST